MDMVFITKISISVVHVLASINVVVFSLLILDFEKISLDMVLVFSEESSNNWTVALTTV